MRVRPSAAVASAAVALVAALLAPVPAYAAPSCPTVALDGTVSPTPAPTVDWSGCDLSGAKLVGAALGASNLNGADLSGADLTDASLVSTLLGGADLTGAVAQRARLDRVVLNNATLRGTDLRDANLSETEWLGAVLDGADLRGATVQSALMKGSLAAGVRSGGLVGTPSTVPDGFLFAGEALLGPRAVLAGEDLSGAVAQYAKLMGADLRGTALAGADLTGADVTGANLLGATGLGTAVLTGVTWGATTTCPDGTLSKVHARRGSCLAPLDTTAPTADLRDLPDVPTTPRLTVRWTASDGDGSGLSVVELRWNRRVSTGGASTAWTTRTYAPGTATWTFTPALGQRYCFSVRARDVTGLVSAWSSPRCTTTVVDDRRLAVTSSWYRSVSSAYIAGTYTATSSTGARLSTTSSVSVRRVSVLALTCSTCGSAAVYVGSRKIGTVSLRSTTTRRALLALPVLSSKASGTVRLVVSRSGTVRVDGLAISDV